MCVFLFFFSVDSNLFMDGKKLYDTKDKSYSQRLSSNSGVMSCHMSIFFSVKFKFVWKNLKMASTATKVAR